MSPGIRWSCREGRAMLATCPGTCAQGSTEELEQHTCLLNLCQKIALAVLPPFLCRPPQQMNEVRT